MSRLFTIVAVFVFSLSTQANAELHQPIELGKQPLRNELVAALDKSIEKAGAEAGVTLFKNRARQHASAGDWKKASADLRRALQREPGQLNGYQQAAVAMLLGGDRMIYQQMVEQFLEAQKKSDNIFSTEKRAKLCVLTTTPVGKQEDVEAWVEAAAAESEGRDWAPYFTATQAFAYYRYEKFEEALKAVEETDRRHAIRGGANKVLYAKTRLIEALCRAKMGDLEAAQAAFKKADDILRSRLANPDLVLNDGNWHDWMFAKIMHDEACDVLNEAGKKAAEKPE